MRKVITIVLLLIVNGILCWAFGKPEAGEYQPVQGLENWDYRLELGERKAGKYNLIVRGTDQAGNIRYEGPYNIFVDPDSDLPVARISHPTAGARVGSLLNVVGTCIDDDGVQAVQVQLDDTDPLPAKGTEFWSLTLDVKDLQDGLHTLSVKGVDVNGTEGPSASVRFNIDKKAPLTRIVSHSSGALVSGQVNLEGQVEDLNGVAFLSLSRDGGSTYEPLRLDLDKPGRQGRFRVALDTRRGPDGPLVLWFKAGDRTESVAQYAFLLFVNNEAPVLEILSPQDEAAVNGRVLVCGRASDRIGLRGLSYEAGGKAESVQLAPGNPFWAQEIDLGTGKAGTVQVQFTLENLAGVRQTARLRLRIDPEADRPRLAVLAPPQGARLAGPVLVSGVAQDDDRVDHVEYSLDGAAPVQVPAEAAFDLVLEQVPAGNHKLVLKAIDAGGAVSQPVVVTFSQAGTPPVIQAGSLIAAAGSLPFTPGVVLAGDKDARLTGTIRFDSASLKAEYILAGAAPKPLTLKKTAAANEQQFDLPLPKGLPPGRIDFSMKATDAAGGVGEFRSFLFKGSEQGEPGIILVDARLGSNAVRLELGPLAGFVTGGGILAAELDPPTDRVRLETEGPVFRVVAGEPGVSEPTRIRVTAADGSRYSTEALRFTSDSGAPQLEIERPRTGDWFSSEMVLEGLATDPTGPVAAEYSLDGGNFVPLDLARGGAAGRFSAPVPLSSLADGPHLLALRAADRAGNAVSRQVVFHKDGTAPTLTFIAPRPQDEVNGVTTLIGRAEDAGRIIRVEVSEGGGAFREVSQQALFRLEVNLSSLGEGGIVFRCLDAAGNSGQFRPELKLNLAADRPVVQVQLPAEDELLRNDFALSGMVFDDDGIAAIYYRVDGGEFQRLEPGNAFSVPLTFKEIGDNAHTVEVQAEDLGGLRGEIASRRFQVSTSDPLSELLSPAISEHRQGVVVLEGKSQDPNGISEVWVSFDNGLSFYQAEGTESWRYRLESRLLADGTHAVLVRAVDATGAAGLYTTTINIDNQEPELVLDNPLDGQVCTDTLRLDGRCLDNIGVASLAASVSPVNHSKGSSPADLNVRLTVSGVLGQEIDLRALPAGWYNLQVEAADRAGNRGYVSRNFLKQAGTEAERVELYYPAAGERLAGPFAVSGRVIAGSVPENALILVDGQPFATSTLSPQGHFRADVEAGALEAGEHTLAVEAELPEDVRLSSGPRKMWYLPSGPWVRISSFAPGDYVTGRPYLAGEVGWFEGPELAEDADGKGSAKKPAEHKVRLVEVSTDNGRSFRKADGRESWKYRLESQELPKGALRLLVKATFENETTAVTRTQLSVDTRLPEVKLLEPEEGGRFNESVQLLGTAFDESGLKEVAVSLRDGDKSRYQVPSFIQGLYLDLHTMGATYWDVGMGLTFFDDNVKLQVQIGMSPPGRFSGLVLGAKLLANVANLPFGYLFGPSWDFFSMSLAVGANFSYFTMSQDTVAFTDAGLVLGGMVAQLEFARFQIASWRLLNTYALYTEYQLWFISSDVEAGTASRISFGLRLGLL